MLELLEQMTRGNEQETRQFMIICIDTIEKFPLDDMQTPLFIFERLCNLIYPEETMQGNKEFFIVVEKDPNQEDFLQGELRRIKELSGYGAFECCPVRLEAERGGGESHSRTFRMAE
jgi:hypothetical protein